MSPAATAASGRLSHSCWSPELDSEMAQTAALADEEEEEVVVGAVCSLGWESAPSNQRVVMFLLLRTKT